MQSPRRVLGAVLVSCVLGAAQLGTACSGNDERPKPLSVGKAGTQLPDEATVGSDAIVPPEPASVAPPPSPRLPEADGAGALGQRIDSYFDALGRHRLYIQVDKPLYKPGESIWIKSWDLKLRAEGGGPAPGVVYELFNPRGARMLHAHVEQRAGSASYDFALPQGAPGGEYKLRATTDDGIREERAIVVSRYEAPRIKKQLEFMRKAYGPGDEVKATLTVKRPTGEALSQKSLRAVAELDGQRLSAFEVSTNANGGAIVAFQLPQVIERGDGLLSVLIDDGGITESISKSIPIVLQRVQLSFFPEGGDLIEGLPSRLYFEAKTPLGKPADVEGTIVDDQGQPAARFATYHFGLGRAEFTPSPGRTYHAELSKPAGITSRFALPLAREQGCVLRSFDDYDGQLAEARVEVACSRAQSVLVAGVLRDKLIDAASVAVEPGKPARVYLRNKDEASSRARGVLRVTAFDSQQQPLAERLVFRNRRRGLRVQVETDTKEYSPREQVALTIKTSDGDGNPVPAELALSVVDDTVVAFADDKTGHIESRLLLEQEIADKVEEPKFFFDLKEKKAAQALDLLMGTRGYRRFEWKPVLAEPRQAALRIVHRYAADVPEEEGALEQVQFRRDANLAFDRFAAGNAPMAAPRPAAIAEQAVRGARAKKVMNRMEDDSMAAPPPAAARPAAPPPAPEKAQAAARPARELARKNAGPAAQDELSAAEPAPGVLKEKREAALRDVAFDAERAIGELEDKDAERDLGPDQPAKAPPEGRIVEHVFVGTPRFAPVRVFPAPTYTGAFSGVRSDFRETVHWAPNVQTDSRGKAVVTFYLSDAITSFRVFAEGSGAGAVGRAEKVFKSSLPFSMSAKLPLEVSAGDTILLPLTLSNERGAELPISLVPEFGALLRPTASVALPEGKLAGNSRQSLFYPLAVEPRTGSTSIAFRAEAGGLKDELVRQIDVVAPGFPQQLSRSGRLAAGAKQTLSFEVGAALPESLVASVSFDPGPTVTLLRGIEGMVREPSGCFEQTSSTNYPNVMVLDYLKTQANVDPQLLQRVNATLERGYAKLVAFETQEKGFEWFGQSPAHEALTAYGVAEFADMKRVWGGVDSPMLARTVAYLKTRRDGKGGFQRNPRALDSFGGADPRITDAYIVYALTEAGFTDFEPELQRQAELAQNSDDAYLVALVTQSLLNVPSQRSKGMAFAKRLSGMQRPDGHFDGKLHSITRSTGRNLQVEATALGTLALLDAGAFPVEVRRASEWLVKARSGFGDFGATQATVLALKALTAIATQSRSNAGSGEIVLIVNGTRLPPQKYDTSQHEPVVFQGLGQALRAGSNQIELVNQGKAELTFSLGVEYRSLQPASDPQTVVELKTDLARTELEMGDGVRLNVTLKNKTEEGQPMTLARIGLPGGLSAQNWQLKELVDKKLIAFYETRAREVIVYLRQMTPGETLQIPLDLVATIPGQYTGPASSAYLYYSNDRKTWAAPLKVEIHAPRAAR